MINARLTGSCLKMTNIRLDRPDVEGFALGSAFSKHPMDRTDFNWVANAGAGTMCLDIACIARIHAAVLVDRAYQ